ncbi:MAG: VOC family protein [Planctomycetaceae bacterium]|nr:VOC family protein [Planctomycetaceae bacterium]
MNLPRNTAVWFEIPVADLDKARDFYQQVMQVNLIPQEAGPNKILIFPVADMETGISGHLYQGKPGNDNGPTIHLGAPAPLEDSLKRVVEAGGSVISDEIEIPGGRFVYCKDPDGNSISLYQCDQALESV